MSESAHHAPAPQSAPIYQVVDISKVKRQGETWLLNSQLTYTDSQNFSSVHFISNGQSFTTISHFPKTISNVFIMIASKSITALHFGLMITIE